MTPRSRPRKGIWLPDRVRWFYFAIALFTILLSGIGFSPSIADASRRNAPATPLVVVHGALALAWLLLFLAQAWLVATERVAAHRRLGRYGPLIAVLLVVVGYLVTMNMARRGHDLSGDLDRVLVAPGAPPLPPAMVLFPLAELLTFGALVAAGLAYRHRPDVHKRLMLLALIPLAQEPVNHLLGHLIGHWPALFRTGRSISRAAGPGLTLLFLAIGTLHDRVEQGRIHPVSLWAPVLVLAWMIALPLMVFPSAAWHELAAWLVSFARAS
jgi:hypothetical protein